MDLIAPAGSIDAGDAGIRSTGKLNVAAQQILNASNIQSSGGSTGTPAPSVSTPSLSLATTTPSQPSNDSKPDPTKQERDEKREREEAEAAPSLWEVKVEGYGGD